MSRDLTLHVIRCTIANQPARVYSCNRREAHSFARRLHARVTTQRLPHSWQLLLSPNDRPVATPRHDHVAAISHTSSLRLVRSR